MTPKIAMHINSKLQTQDIYQNAIQITVQNECPSYKVSCKYKTQLY